MLLRSKYKICLMNVNKRKHMFALENTIRRLSYDRNVLPNNVFSGIQPTGCIHLGNYLGAINNWKLLQDAGERTVYSIVDLHSLTSMEENNLLENTLLMTASLIASGIDPSKSILFLQSKVSEHTKLAWILTCMVSMNKLTHLPQYKERLNSPKSNAFSTGIFLYPILQAADILLYKTTHVPVGEDQLQHLNLSSDIAKMFNNKYGNTFTVPTPILCNNSSSRIKNLKDPLKKMSKSDVNSKTRIELLDTPEEIRKKIRRAVTDFTSAIYYDPTNRPGVSNLITIHSALTDKSYEEIREENKFKDTGEYKNVVADSIIHTLNPIREMILELLKDKNYLIDTLYKGSEKAKALAQPMMYDIYKKIGVVTR